MEEFGRLVFDARKRARMTQAELAKRAGCSKNYVSMLERAAPHSQTGSYVRPSEAMVETLARSLCIPVPLARQAAGYRAEESLSISSEVEMLFQDLTPEQQRVILNAAKAIRDTFTGVAAQALEEAKRKVLTVRSTVDLMHDFCALNVD